MGHPEDSALGLPLVLTGSDATDRLKALKAAAGAAEARRDWNAAHYYQCEINDHICNPQLGRAVAGIVRTLDAIHEAEVGTVQERSMR